MTFNEDLRVKISATLNFRRLGYINQSRIRTFRDITIVQLKVAYVCNLN